MHPHRQTALRISDLVPQVVAPAAVFDILGTGGAVAFDSGDGIEYGPLIFSAVYRQIASTLWTAADVGDRLRLAPMTSRPGRPTRRRRTGDDLVLPRSVPGRLPSVAWRPAVEKNQERSTPAPDALCLLFHETHGMVIMFFRERLKRVVDGFQEERNRGLSHGYFTGSLN